MAKGSLTAHGKLGIRGSGAKLTAGVADVYAWDKARDKERSAKAARKSAEKRKAKNAPRDRKIHDAHAERKSPKAIAAALKISISTVSRVLKKTRP